MKRMKHNLIFTLAIALFFVFQSTDVKASHIMGGDLTFTCLGGSTYMLQLRLFRDCNGIPLGNQESVTLTSPSCGTQTFNLNLLTGYPIIITPLCPTEVDRCNSGSGTYGVHEYVYKGPITLTGCWATASDITVSWSSCCRNGAITTAAAGSTYISTDLNAGLSPCNNSPDFLNSPVAFFCVNQPVNYSHGASDPDNDVMVFSLVDCLQGAGNSVAYNAPNSGTNPLTTAGGVTIDPQTGALQFTPTITQTAIVCVLVEEYRNGVKIGEVVRDMQFEIIMCNNNLPVASGMNGTATATGTTGANTLSVCAGDTVQFTVDSYDANYQDIPILQIGIDSIEMSWNQAIGGASFTSSGTALPTGTFFWIPTNSDVGNNVFTVNLQDQGCPIRGVGIFSYLITVLEKPEMDAGPSQVTCAPGDVVNLNATFTTTTSQTGAFSWTPTTALTNANAQITDANPDTTTTYTTFVTYNNGCTYIDSLIIEVTDGITLPALTDTTICQGDVQLDATVSTSIGGGLSFSNTTGQAIPDNDPIGITSTIVTSGVSPAAMSGTTIDSVCLTINHLLSSDVDIYLVSPNGVQIELSTDNGGGSNYTNTCFTPTSSTLITAGNSPFTGTFRPEGNFANFIGSQTNGDWELKVVDDNSFFTGSLVEWSIHFASPNQVNYTWTPSATLSCSTCPDPLATPTSTTTYTVIGSNQNGCADTGMVTITVEDTLQAPIINCAGITPNSLTFCWSDVSGSTGYEINVDNAGWITPNGPGNLCHTVTGLAVTQTVNVQVRGLTNCSNSTILIGTQNCTTAPCTLDGTLGTLTNVSCNGGNDGSVIVTASGGTPPYEFSIDGGATKFPTGTFNSLTSGNYTVTVIDSFACLDTVNFTITEPTPIALVMSADSVSCFEGTDGVATVVASGGSGGYVYQWSTVGGNIPTINGLATGTYTVTVTDANNCTNTASILVEEPDSITLTSTSFDVSCNGAGDGSITVAATGANGTYSYAWTGSASTTATAGSLSGGIYTATVTDFKGCSNIISDTINENTAIALTVDSIPALCNTSADGSAIVVATGGTGTYTYLWDAAAGSQLTATASNVAAGTYTVTVTDSDGCSNTITATVTSPSAMSSSMTSTAVFCDNSTDGTATITVTGGTATYTYNWANSNDNSATADSLGVGFQAVTVTDANGCQWADSVQVMGPTPISIALTPTTVTCFGNADGAVSSTVSGGAGGYTYAWNNSVATTANLTNISGGNYIVTVTDANGCFDTASTIVLEPVSLIITLDSTDVSCFNGSDGSTTVTASGGTMPFVYFWSPSNQSTPTATNVSAGWHTVTVTDAVGCSAVDSIFVNQPATGVTTTTSFTPLVCNGDGSGTATVTAIGGSGNYTYAWNTTPVQTTATATGLQAGSYTIVVTDINGCDYTDAATVTEPTPVVTAITMTPASCNGYNDGTATTTPAGGMGNYTYAWSTTPTQTDSIATNLVAGSYTVTVTDANGCTTTNTVTVTEPNGMTLTMSTTPVTCNSGNDGTTTVAVTGGTGTYSYAWSAFANDASTATGLMAGWHTVTVTDVNGCLKVDSIEVLEPDTLTVTLTGTDVSCFGGSDGAANAIPVGGLGAYTYAWSTTPTQALQGATGLVTGTYTVTVTDGNGCTATGSVFIGQPADGVTTTMSATSVNCNGGSDGTATVSAIGGAGNYTYLWNNTQTGATATGLQAGTYTVTITDQNGCFVTDQVTVSEPSAITVIVGQTSTSCFGGSDGRATVAASGGVPDANGGYTYVWNSSPVQTGSTAVGLNGGQTYTVTVTDENGCTAISSVVISQPTQIQLNTTQTNISCNGFSDGTATVNAGGGTPGYTYLWDANASSQTTSTASNLAIGTYTVTVTDVNNCTEEISVTITEPSPLAITSITDDVICKGASTGSVKILAAGGTPWYSFQWDANAGNQTGNELENLAAGNYTVTMTDANGCQIVETITINEPSTALRATTNPDDVSCFGDRDGQIAVTATGGAIPYQYSLDGNSYTNSNELVGLTSGEYIVRVRDDVGCIFTDTVLIEEPLEIIVDAGEDIYVEFGEPAPILVSVQNGQIPLFYSWTPNDSLASLSCDNCPVPLATPANDMFYQVQVTDANGCIGYDDIAVRLNKVREVYVATGFSPNRDGVNDYLFVQGGEQSMRVVEFKVYDRWGETVFTAADTPLNVAEQGWDGLFNGERMNSGVYGWTAVIEFADGERLLYKGNTTLIK
jgi:gliding motility-associated-like protein